MQRSIELRSRDRHRPAARRGRRPSASPRCSSAASTATRRSRSARSPTIRREPSGSSTTCACACTAACARPGSSRDPRSGGPPEADRRAVGRRRRRSPVARAAGTARRNAVAVVLLVARRRPDRARRSPGSARLPRSRTAARSTSLQPGVDRPELVRLRGRRLAARLDPRRAQPPAGAALRRSARGCRKATIAIEDRRFYQHGGVDYEGIVRAAWRDVQTRARSSRAARRSRSSSSATSTSRASGRFQRKVKEACLAIKLSKHWSKERILADVPEPGLLRQPRLRRRGRSADVLLEARRRT